VFNPLDSFSHRFAAPLCGCAKILHPPSPTPANLDGRVHPWNPADSPFSKFVLVALCWWNTKSWRKFQQYKIRADEMELAQFQPLPGVEEFDPIYDFEELNPYYIDDFFEEHQLYTFEEHLSFDDFDRIEYLFEQLVFNTLLYEMPNNQMVTKNVSKNQSIKFFLAKKVQIKKFDTNN
jgi:hypothetical protein